MVGPDVFENVVLTDAQMFEQMPEGVRAVRQSGIDMRFRETGNRVLEDHVRLAFGQHAGQLGSQFCAGIHCEVPFTIVPIFRCAIRCR
jgi:hypothetical protein